MGRFQDLGRFHDGRKTSGADRLEQYEDVPEDIKEQAARMIAEIFYEADKVVAKRCVNLR